MAEIDFSVPCWYTCEKEPGMEDYDCRKTCHRYMHMNYFIVNCGMPNANKYLKPMVAPKIDLNAYKQLQVYKNNIVQYVEQAFNLAIISDKTQNGKTTWSLKIMYKYFDGIWAGSDYIPRGYFIYVPKFLDDLKTRSFRSTDKYLETDNNLRNADIVVWDDIITYSLKQDDRVLLNTYISLRLMYGKANIFNGIDKGNMKDKLGDRLTNLIEGADKVILNAPPYEPKKNKSREEDNYVK